ncbi:M20/M25/M40 family metallo-hydrolase [Mucilaginibacter sp. BJC16-A38]|uniref:M28 family metallopeptidase n=1 Tax=Mucilaginibacter phenanthrenivorans TaxID=1234842 RepID=UPI0021578BBA|nr:M20/M25/M40 family metallo-hydrolase [Mucilaginibacter phenanthrenivorans]MCR8561202.1 M20/M25/M40 family metallo-hydrolase [Mucilaginibacter phenanthrenivorans]
MKKFITAILICVAFAAQAQTIKQLKQDMYGIASDATEGRFTGSPGYLKAARYVAGQLKAAGLKTTLQSVPFVWDNYDGSILTIEGITYQHKGGNFIVLQYSTSEPGHWMILKSIPDSSETEKLLKEKVAGVILLPNKQQSGDWETTVIRQYRFGYMHYAADYVPANAPLSIITISPALAEKVNDGQKLLVNLKFRTEKVNGYNVIASLPGADRKRKNQTIIAGAHLDHIGRLGAHIYNGANDDAGGCVALMAAARSFSKHFARRSIMFVFYCGEELNLLGSRYFMEHPPIPVKDIILNINLEQIGSKHRSFHGIWAIGDPQFHDSFFASGSMFTGADLKYSPTDSLRDVLSNTDSYSFMKKNVPSVLLGSGGFDEHHTPEDKIDLIDFAHLQKASRLLVSLIGKLAN